MCGTRTLCGFLCPSFFLQNSLEVLSPRIGLYITMLICAGYDKNKENKNLMTQRNSTRDCLVSLRFKINYCKGISLESQSLANLVQKLTIKFTCWAFHLQLTSQKDPVVAHWIGPPSVSPDSSKKVDRFSSGFWS